MARVYRYVCVCVCECVCVCAASLWRVQGERGVSRCGYTVYVWVEMEGCFAAAAVMTRPRRGLALTSHRYAVIAQTRPALVLRLLRAEYRVLLILAGGGGGDVCPRSHVSSPTHTQPVPFAAGAFLFGPAAVLHEVPHDPGLSYLFHGEEELYRWGRGGGFARFRQWEQGQGVGNREQRLLHQA